MPEITAHRVAEYLASTQSVTTEGGSTSPGGEPGAPGAGADTGADTQPAGHPHPPPFNQHEVLMPCNTCPCCTIGKLVFRQGWGSDVASAASIGKNGIRTAGQCVHAGHGQPSGWSTNMVFVSACKDVYAPCILAKPRSAGTGPPSGPARPEGPSPGNVGSPADPSPGQPWTDAQMGAAKPLPLPEGAAARDLTPPATPPLTPSAARVERPACKR